MSVRRDNFTMGVYFGNNPYTPQQVADYITGTSGEGFADPNKVKALVEESSRQLRRTVDTHKLTMDQILQADTSEAGKELAQLTLSDCDAVIKLIAEGASGKGTLI